MTPLTTPRPTTTRRSAGALLIAAVCVLALAGGFTVLEIVEVARKSHTGRTGLLVLAFLAAVLHATAGVVTLRRLVPARIRTVPDPVG